MRTVLIALVVAALGFAAFLFVPGGEPPVSYSLSRIDIADTEAERTAGLSGREVPEDYGMLFVFETEGSYGFWMKDTLAPLDVIWLSNDGIVLGIEHAAAPETYPTVFYPPSPVRYVLEARGGTAKRKDWGPGTRLSLPIPE